MNNFLAYASAKYYAGEPIISDDEFDLLVDQYGYEYVGSPVDTTKAVKHLYPMYSLQKCYIGEKQIELPGEIVETPKLDGVAISILYVNGKLSLALTRGDGKAGQDITDKIRFLVPIDLRGDYTFQVTGEVITYKEISNARNYAAGALNLKSIEEFQQRKLFFIAYGLSPYQQVTYDEDMRTLEILGFDTIYNIREWSIFPQDGKVFRVNDNKVFTELGYTAKHPRGAYALKDRPEGIITTLLDVQWQVGRSGKVTPVAILEPVMIGDATISRATLNNSKYIKDLNLEIGCQVEVVRNGEIIPGIVRRVDC